MRTVKPPQHTDEQLSDTSRREDEEAEHGLLTGVTVLCPECARPLSVHSDAATRPTRQALPEHAVCATPWDPFGLTVCAGSGRPAAEADWPRLRDTAESGAAQVIRALPEGLDWRLQPFSHRPASRAARAQPQPELRQAA